MKKKIIKLLTAFTVSSLLGFSSLITSAQEVTLVYQVNDKITLIKNAKRYSTAEDAMNKANSVGEYTSGEFYVFMKDDNGSINVTKNKGEPGSWINPEDLTVQDPGVESQVFFLGQEAKRYETEEDAVNGVNSVGTYEPGKYHTYKLTEKAINLSKTKGIPGSWVSLADLNNNEVPKDKLVYLKEEVKVFATSDEAKAQSMSPNLLKPGLYFIDEEIDGAVSIKRNYKQKSQWIHKDKSTPLVDLDESAVDIYWLDKDSDVYETSEDAINQTKPIKKYESGWYYIFKTKDNTINITGKINNAGAWIKTSN